MVSAAEGKTNMTTKHARLLDERYGRQRRWVEQAQFLVRQWQDGPCCHSGYNCYNDRNQQIIGCASCDGKNQATYLDRRPGYPETESPRLLATNGVSMDRLVAAIGMTVPVCASCYCRRLQLRGDREGLIRVLRAIERAKPPSFLLSQA